MPQVKAIADTGANVVVTGGESGRHGSFIMQTKYNIMLNEAIKLKNGISEDCVCKTVGAYSSSKIDFLSLKKMDIVTVFASEVEILRWWF